MHDPLISIIITILNGEKTIVSCLESIHRQVFRNYEVIIVDGGSTDRTLFLVENSPVHKTIKIIDGCGIYEGLNEGVILSKGEWLYFMGSDDKLHDDTVLQNISCAINDFRAFPFHMILGNVYCISQNELLRPKTGSPFLMRYHVHHQGIFYNRILFSEIRYDELRKVASDYELNLKLSLKKTPYIILNKIFCDFEGNGTSEKQLSLRNKEIIEIHEAIFNSFYSRFVNSQFRLRTLMGHFLRKYELVNFRQFLKKVFT